MTRVGDDLVDGHRLLGEAVLFGRELRAAGLAVDLGAAVDFARALNVVDVGEREQVRAAGSAVFVRRHDDGEVYDIVFDRFWRRRQSPLDDLIPFAESASARDAGPDAGDPQGEAGDESVTAGLKARGIAAPDDASEAPAQGDVDRFDIAPDAFSRAEVVRHRDFDKMTPAELRDAERLVDLLRPRLELRRTRRYELHHHGRLLAPRAMLRRNLATGGQLTEWVWRRAVRRPRRIVVICDISGSMERHSRLLLRFVQALTASTAVHTESFVFGTRLTRVTRLLRDRDRDRALTRVAKVVNDWAGGTRIGESFRDFNRHWARRTLRSSGVVIVVSDGWDRGDPALVEVETARLRRNCHRLIWLNPLAGTPGYQPLAAGMRAAYPYIDDFLPAGTVASLERLGEILAGIRGGDTGPGSEAAARVAPDPDGTLGTGAERTFGPPPPIARGGADTAADPSTAQPLR
ncbi:MAG TPA: VWA domain-containing protein [Candidatus Limnocylindrales bacterium]